MAVLKVPEVRLTPCSFSLLAGDVHRTLWQKVRVRKGKSQKAPPTVGHVKKKRADGEKN